MAGKREKQPETRTSAEIAPLPDEELYWRDPRAWFKKQNPNLTEAELNLAVALTQISRGEKPKLRPL